MNVVARHLGGVLEITTPRFHDERGSFATTFNTDAAHSLGLPDRFVQDNESISVSPGTVRGLHLQLPPHGQGKLVRVSRGAILDVVVDARPGSLTVGQHVAVELNADIGTMLWIPSGFAHGFCTLEADTQVQYKVDASWQPEAERTISWDDPALAISWPVESGAAILSDKDACGATFAVTLAEIENAGFIT